MKMIKCLLGLLAVSIMAGCSADDISGAELENWPSDFSVQEYGEVNFDLIKVQMKDSIAARNALKKKTSADMDAKELNLFFDSEESVKKIFTKYKGFDESIWPGYETLRDGKIYIDFRTPLYDYHIWGNTATKDLQYLDSFKPNYEVIKMQYVLVGKIEGRPYRYCKDKESKTLKAENESQAVAVASKWDFSAHFYCKNKKDGQVYLIP